ncbi:MAG: glycerate kinase [Bacteroidota bacterium]|nr:glycerate kinase [Bacteroidota bacterium]MDP4204620.1 glycerate kinase [Bacteroidota bacterium]
MNILLAPNSMKGSLNAFDFADSVERGLSRASADFCITKCPVADGGDFSAPVLAKSLGASEISVIVRGPIGKPVHSRFFMTPDHVALIEMADASGLRLISPEERNPLKAGSYGLGELILAACSHHAKRILLGVGGSATVDGGMGMMQALGMRFYDEGNHLLEGNGANLIRIDHVEWSRPKDLSAIEINVLCDVSNPLIGPSGAAAVFGPQKGASPSDVEFLESGLLHWSKIISSTSECPFQNKPFTGAAGGVSAALNAFLNANLVSGADYILDTINFNSYLSRTDLVITGEGLLDAQTSNLKAPFVVASRARVFGKRIIALAGGIKDGEHSVYDAVFSISPGPVSLEFSLQNAEILTEELSFNLGKLIRTFI